MTTRGIRLNNPGNIRKGVVRWVGQTSLQPDPAFVQFIAPAYGFRAMVKLFLTYRGRGLGTVREIISAWAPETENDTAAYIADVADRSGFHPDAPIDVRDPATAIALAYAITLHEQADAWPLDYHDAVKEGAAMAIGGGDLAQAQERLAQVAQEPATSDPEPGGSPAASRTTA